MDDFDFAPDPKEDKPKQKFGTILLTLGTYYFLASSVFLIAYFILIYINPYHPLNPLMPPTPAAEESNLDVVSATSTVPQATFTLTPTVNEMQGSAVELPAQFTPTATFIPYPTPTDVVLATSKPADTPEGLVHFSARENSPSYIEYGGGCSGIFVAGNVVDINDRPVVLMTVRATGTIGEQTIDLDVLSGSHTEYSESGWEIQLSDQMINTSGMITIGLYAQGNKFDPISDLVVINTYDDCSRNLAVVNFVQVQE